MEHVGALPVDQRVAVGMGVLDMDDLDVVAIEVEGQIVAERHHRQRPGRRRRHDLGADQLLHRHAAPDIVVGDDDGAGAAEILVPAAMVAMPVGVDDEAHRIGIDRAHRGEDALGQRRKLVVDQDVAVGAVGKADIAAGAEQDGDARRDPLDPDLDGAPVALRLRRGRRGEAKCECGDDDAHESPPVFVPV